MQVIGGDESQLVKELRAKIVTLTNQIEVGRPNILPPIKQPEPEIDFTPIHNIYKEKIDMMTKYNEQYLKEMETLKLENARL